MTIESVTKMWSRDNADFISPDGITRSTTIREGYQVVHSADVDWPFEVAQASGLPSIGDYYPNTDYIFCRKATPQRASPVLTFVDVEYTGEVGKNDDNPLNADPDIEWSDVTTTEAIDQDIYGRAIVTANGEPIYGVTKEISDQVVTIRRKYQQFSPFLTALYRDSVSSDPFLTYPAGTARMIRFSARPAGGYWDVSASIQFRMPYRTSNVHAWSVRVRHEGFYERTGAVVSFANTGSDAAGAAAAVSVSGGAVTSIYLLSGGAKYSTGTTVSITGGGGTGATATCSVDSKTGEIKTVTLTNGGSGYSSRIAKAVDDYKEPVVKPVLLKANGTRETNPNNALWLLVPVYAPLPYSALGLV